MSSSMADFPLGLNDDNHMEKVLREQINEKHSKQANKPTDEWDARHDADPLGPPPPMERQAPSNRCAGIECLNPVKFRCSSCKKVYYCSTECQKRTNDFHVFACVGRRIDSAHRLVDDCFQDELPFHPDVLHDFGFVRCKTGRDRAQLYGIYQGLAKVCEINSRILRAWSMSDTLLENIKSVYEARPSHLRGGYYPWLASHQYVLDASLPDVKVDMNVSRLQAFLFRGQVPSRKQNAMWVRFGFSSCDSKYWEGTSGQLANLYTKLFKTVDFATFQKYYVDGGLYKLAENNGLKAEVAELRKQGVHENGGRSVYKLLAFVRSDNPAEECPRPVLGDYGYCMCETEAQKKLWRIVFRTLIGRPKFNERELDEACLEGRIFGYAKWLWPEVPAEFEVLSRNLYPFEENEEGL